MLVLTLSGAFACGGLFCDAIQPVEQAGEQIVFAVDSQAGTTTMHVEITYEGPAEEFAWVLPVRGVPELEVSSKDLFDLLDATTAPRVGTSQQLGEQCLSFDADSGLIADTAAPPAPPGVEVLATQAVGPYETTTLAATDASELVTWLQDNGYAVPDLLSNALTPYIGQQMRFVALRLAKNRDAGDLRPLALTYADSTPAIPLVLTRVAAQDDMPVTVYVLGEARAVPDNYLHVQLNPLNLDYWSLGANYHEVITAAADEAGGQAFATDLSSSTELLADVFHSANLPSATDLSDATNARDFVDSLWSRGFPQSEDLMDVLRTHLPLTTVPQGAEDTDVYACPACYPSVWAGVPYDGPAAQAAVEGFLDQRLNTQEMVNGTAWVTRLRSSISADEMTLDPTFALNYDMDQVVDNQWVVTILSECDSDGEPWTAPQRLTLPGGLELLAPSPQALSEQGSSLHDWLVSQSTGAALVIEDTAGTDAPVVIVDNTPLVPEARDDADTSPQGCGCATSSGGGIALLPLVLLGLVGRRLRSPIQD